MISKSILAVGIEFEGYFSKRGLDITNKANKYMSTEPLFQKLKGDGSVSCTREEMLSLMDKSGFNVDQFRSGEVNTTILTNPKDLEKAISIMGKLYQSGDYYYNGTCGLHYHISMKDWLFPNIINKEFYDEYVAKFKSKNKKVYEDRSTRHYSAVGAYPRHFNPDSADRYNAIRYAWSEFKTVEFRLYGGSSAKLKQLHETILWTINLMEKYAMKSEVVAEPVDVEVDNYQFITI